MTNILSNPISTGLETVSLELVRNHGRFEKHILKEILVLFRIVDLRLSCALRSWILKEVLQREKQVYDNNGFLKF